MAGALQTAAELFFDAEIDVRIKITEDTSPQSIADNMLLLADNCNAIAVVSVVHPIVMQTVAALEERGIPIVALISQLSRPSAWAMASELCAARFRKRY